MSFDIFTKENLDTYLKELAKAFRKINGKSMPAEIVLVGGAAILTNYGFRDMTTDIDAVIHAASSMKDAIKNGNFENVYASVKNTELESRNLLIEFEKEYPNSTNESNADEIIKSLKEKRNK